LERRYRPGRSNVPRQAVFVLDKPIGFDGGTLLKFKLTQNHGGWNSDDNQNNNVGRFRFSVATTENAQADPVPAGVRKILETSPAAHSRSNGDRLQLLANDRARVATGE